MFVLWMVEIIIRFFNEARIKSKILLKELEIQLRIWVSITNRRVKNTNLIFGKCLRSSNLRDDSAAR